MKLSEFSTLTFDCYGTLIDWESGMIAGLGPLTSRLPEPPSRNEILQAHAYHESTQQKWTPSMRYSDLLAIVYKRLAEAWGVHATQDECDSYGQSVKDWPAFSDSADSLHYLKQHYNLVILSNVDNRSFAGSNQRLQVNFDAVYTAEDVGSYKPSDRNFEYMLEQLTHRGISPHSVLHTAESMFHDHVPGKRHNLASCWIFRRHDKEGFGATMNPGELPQVDFQFNSMAALVEAHKAELSNV